MADNGRTSYRKEMEKMQQSMKNSWGSASKEYRAVLGALREVVSYREQDVGMTSREMIEAHTRLGKACETYLKTRKGAFTDKGQERLGMVGAIYGLQQAETEKVNELRSPSALRENSKRTWGDVLAEQRVREIDVTGMDLKTVGAGSSTRTVVPMGDDIGFFTENKKLLRVEELYADLQEKQKNPEAKAAFGRMMEDPLELELLGNFAGYGLGGDFNLQFAGTMEKGEKSKKITGWDHLSQEAKEAFSNDMKEVAKYQNITYKVAEDAGVEYGSNLTVRNVASTRLAELLGQNDLLAKSEKVCLNNRGVKTEGVVMARANGIDFNSEKQADINRFGKTDDFTDPNFQRQVSNLEIIDYLAGQTDRNVGNMFYQFSDEAGGKPRPTGIQGIDNDAAFGSTMAPCPGTVPISKINMIDVQLAENLRQIDKAALEYTFGDILNANEINRLDQRFQDVKGQLSKARIMQPFDWNAQTSAEMIERGGYLGTIHKDFRSRGKLVKEDAEIEAAAPAGKRIETDLEGMMKEEQAAKEPGIKENLLAGREKTGPEKAAPGKEEHRFTIGGHRAPGKSS